MSPADDAAERAYRALLIETMRPCRELSREERAAKREADQLFQRALEDREIAARPDLKAV